MINETVTISTHEDFMGEAGEEIVTLYKIYAKENLEKLGYDDIEFNDRQNTYSVDAPISRSSDEYRNIEDAIGPAWAHALE